MTAAHDSPDPTHALVLLSGGLDSVAALHWALSKYASVASVTFEYGQPQRDAEVIAAGRIAKRLGVPNKLIHLGHAVRGDVSLHPPDRGTAPNGISKANLLGRNLLFLAAALGEAGRTWPGESVALVLGSNAADAAFPDCSVPFVASAMRALTEASLGVMKRVDVVAPWITSSKTQILRWCAATGRDAALRDVSESVSCYAGRHCGTCDPCVLRAEAFGNAALLDVRWLPSMFGGDPARSDKLARLSGFSVRTDARRLSCRSTRSRIICRYRAAPLA